MEAMNFRQALMREVARRVLDIIPRCLLQFTHPHSRLSTRLPSLLQLSIHIWKPNSSSYLILVPLPHPSMITTTNHFHFGTMLAVPSAQPQSPNSETDRATWFLRTFVVVHRLVSLKWILCAAQKLLRFIFTFTLQINYLCSLFISHTPYIQRGIDEWQHSSPEDEHQILKNRGAYPQPPHSSRKSPCKAAKTSVQLRS